MSAEKVAVRRKMLWVTYNVNQGAFTRIKASVWAYKYFNLDVSATMMDAPTAHEQVLPEAKSYGSRTTDRAGDQECRAQQHTGQRASAGNHGAEVDF